MNEALSTTSKKNFGYFSPSEKKHTVGSLDCPINSADEEKSSIGSKKSLTVISYY
jgi:hypothetical protein